MFTPSPSNKKGSGRSRTQYCREVINLNPNYITQNKFAGVARAPPPRVDGTAEGGSPQEICHPERSRGTCCYPARRGFPKFCRLLGLRHVARTLLSACRHQRYSRGDSHPQLSTRAKLGIV